MIVGNSIGNFPWSWFLLSEALRSTEQVPQSVFHWVRSTKCIPLSNFWQAHMIFWSMCVNESCLRVLPDWLWMQSSPLIHVCETNHEFAVTSGEKTHRRENAREDEAYRFLSSSLHLLVCHMTIVSYYTIISLSSCFFVTCCPLFSWWLFRREPIKKVLISSPRWKRSKASLRLLLDYSTR